MVHKTVQAIKYKTDPPGIRAVIRSLFRPNYFCFATI